LEIEENLLKISNESDKKHEEDIHQVLLNQVKDKDDIVIKLGEENSNLANTVAKLKLENEQMREEYVGVLNENKELKNTMQDLNAELQTAIDLSQKKSIGFDITQEEIKRANEEINKLRQEKQDTAIIIEELQKRGEYSAKLKEDNENLQNKHRELEQRLEEMVEDSKKAEEELSNYKDTLVALQQANIKVKELEDEITQKDDVIKELQKSIEQTKEESKKIKATQTDSKKIKERVTHISEDSIGVNMKIDQLQELIEERSEGIKSLRKFNKDENEEIERLRIENKKLSTRVTELGEENTELRKTVAELEHNNEQQNKSIAEECNAKEQLLEELKKANEQTIKLREKNEENNKKTQDLLKNKIETTNKMFKLEKELEEFHKASKFVNKLEDENTLLKATLQEANKEDAINKLEEEKELALVEVNKLRKEVSDLKVMNEKKDNKLKELQEKALNERKMNDVLKEEYDKKIKQLQDFSRTLQQENSQIRKTLHDTNTERDEIQIEYKKAKESKGEAAIELKEIINNIREENKKLASGIYKGEDIKYKNILEDEETVQQQIKVLEHELSINISKKMVVAVKELVHKLNIGFEHSLNDIATQLEIMYKKLDLLNKRISKRLFSYKPTSTKISSSARKETKAVQINESMERVKTHTITQSPERIKSYEKTNYDWRLISELRILRQENIYLQNKITNYPVDVAILKKELERVQKNSATTIHELKLQNKKWMLSLKKCIEEFRKVQDEVAALKGEKIDTNGYIYQLKLRLANMQILFNGCSQRNCILENNTMIQREKIEELEGEIRTIKKERASSAYERQKKFLGEF